MPIAGVLLFTKNLLDGLNMPGGSPALNAWITPPDPDPQPAEGPVAYLWPMPGSEKRQTVPRNKGPGTAAGWKCIRHVIGIYLVWEQAEDDPDADTLFTGYADALCDALRTAWPMPALITDPWTGEITQLADTGEEISYDSPPPRSLADQRYLRYDVLVRVPCTEEIQR